MIYITKLFNNIETYVNTLTTLTYNVQKTRDRTGKVISYIGLPCSYDIETTSYRNADDEKRATAYAMIINVDGYKYICRKWEEVEYIFQKFLKIFGLTEERRLIIYVHNLGFDFQFTAPHLTIDNIFALGSHEPLYAISNGIEFRCSYKLSGKSLAELAKDEGLSVRKLVGDLDYSLLRHSLTPLSHKEIEYIVNDSDIIIEYIRKLMKKYKIGDIPLTKTQFVRRFMRERIKESKEDMKTIRDLKLTPRSYLLLKKAFMGGFTHGSIHNVSKILKDVYSFDFTSSYPAVMVLKKFPMSSPLLYVNPSVSFVHRSINNYACLLEIEFTKIEAKDYIDFPIPHHKCKIEGYREVFNGRIIKADKITIACTDIDYQLYQEMYDYEDVKFNYLCTFKKDYLPRSFIMGVLELYKNKTELKGIKGKEELYAFSKELLNSTFGMTVTDILKSEWSYNQGIWEETVPDIDKVISDYNNSRSRFLFYAWGVWITAYARYNLFTAIQECGYDYIYADTDSVKIFDLDAHKEYFDKYNESIYKEISEISEFYHIPIEMFSPKTISGKTKTIGLWDYEGKYDYFKTNGAKRYMWVKEGVVNVTVAGLKKTTAVPYLLDKFNIHYVQDIVTRECIVADNDIEDLKELFDYFDEGFTVPGEYSGRTAHIYVDEGFTDVLTDYIGIKSEISEKAFINIENASYTINRMNDFKAAILGLREREG